KVQLEAANVLGGRYVGRTVEKCREALAAVDVAPLRVLAELARIHVLDHTLTQRGDSLGCHSQLLSWVRFGTPRSSRQRAPPLPTISTLGITLRTSHTSPLSRSDLVHWPDSDDHINALNVCW